MSAGRRHIAGIRWPVSHAEGSTAAPDAWLAWEPMVQFRLCEVSSSSAIAWIGFAREVLAEVKSESEVFLPPETAAAIEGHLDEWETRATLGPSLSLQVDMPADELEHLGHVFLQLSRYSIEQADRRGYDISPPESDEFFAALSEAVIGALEFSGEDSSTEFATGLRDAWPRTDRLLPDGTMMPVSGRLGPVDCRGR